LVTPLTTLVFLDSTVSTSELENFQNEKKIIISVDYLTHKKLEKLKIKNLVLDDFLNKEDRNHIYDFVVSKNNWYENLRSNKEFLINDINILSLFGKLEFHELVLKNLIKFFSIKNLIEEFKPTKIFVTKKTYSFIKLIVKDEIIQFLDESGNNIREKSFNTNFIEIRFNFLSKPFTFYLSKKKYSKIKGFIENIICKVNRLWLSTNYDDDIVLLLEFNTKSYKKLILELRNSKKQVVLLNRRRPAIFDKNSLKSLKKANVKILNPEHFFNNKTEQEFSLEYMRLEQEIKKLWQSEEIHKIFSKDEFSFWPLIREQFEMIFSYRLDDYLKLLLEARNIFEKLNISTILCLSESGETENAILQTNRNKSNSMLLQHSFKRYNKNIDKHQWQYEDQNIFGLKCKKFLIWGESDFNCFSKNQLIEQEKLIISGSPRHDELFHSDETFETKEKKNILITMSPIVIRSGQGDLDLILKYNSMIGKLISIFKKFKNSEIKFKLHPGENPHNLILLDFLKENSESPIFQTKNIMELIPSSDLIINITPEIYDSSTVMLEGLILNKPVIQLILDEYFNGNKLDDIPINQISRIEDLENLLEQFFNNSKNFNSILLQKNQKIIGKYLSYRGNSSKKICQIINNEK